MSTNLCRPKSGGGSCTPVIQVSEWARLASALRCLSLSSLLCSFFHSAKPIVKPWAEGRSGRRATCRAQDKQMGLKSGQLSHNRCTFRLQRWRSHPQSQMGSTLRATSSLTNPLRSAHLLLRFSHSYNDEKDSDHWDPFRQFQHNLV